MLLTVKPLTTLVWLVTVTHLTMLIAAVPIERDGVVERRYSHHGFGVDAIVKRSSGISVAGTDDYDAFNQSKRRRCQSSDVSFQLLVKKVFWGKKGRKYWGLAGPV